jgi:hypothetical protein
MFILYFAYDLIEFSELTIKFIIHDNKALYFMAYNYSVGLIKAPVIDIMLTNCN